MLFASLFSALLLQTAPLPPDSTAVPSNRKKPGSAGILLGTSVTVVGQRAFRLSPGPVAGFYVHENLNDRWSLQIELHWKQVNGYNLHAVFADTVLNPLGIGVSRAAFQVRTLVFWEAPILVRWRAGPTARHAFSLGVRPSLNMLTGERDRSNWRVARSGGAVPTDLSQLNVRQGLRRSDLGILVGWNYSLTNRLSLDARYTQGLYDLTADNFFKSKSNTLNSDLQVTLRARF